MIKICSNSMRTSISPQVALISVSSKKKTPQTSSTQLSNHQELTKSPNTLNRDITQIDKLNQTLLISKPIVILTTIKQKRKTYNRLVNSRTIRKVRIYFCSIIMKNRNRSHQSHSKWSSLKANSQGVIRCHLITQQNRWSQSI